MNQDTGTSTIGSLLSELREESSTLLRQEVALAKAELNEKTALVGKSALEIAAGGAMAYAGLIVLLIGAGYLAKQGLVAAGVSEEIAQWLGFVVVGAIVAIPGWTMLAKAKKSLKARNLLPQETAASLRDDRRWAENKIHATHEPSR